MIFCEMYRDESFSQMFFALNDNKFRSMENYKEGQVSAVLKFSIVQTTKRTPKICVIVIQESHPSFSFAIRLLFFKIFFKYCNMSAAVVQ